MEKNQSKIMDMRNNENFHLAYYHSHNMKAFGLSLIVFGLEQFKRTNILKRKSEIDLWLENKTLKQNLTNELILEFVFEEIIDAVKISICFENYMKGMLLTKGFVVNELNKDIPEVAALSKAQKSRPIHISELLKVVHWEIAEGGQYHTLKGLKRNTISFSQMLLATYQKEINMPADICKYIKEYNDKRNNLHFYRNSEFQFSKDVTARISRLDDYVDNYILPFYHSLDAELKKPI